MTQQHIWMDQNTEQQMIVLYMFIYIYFLRGACRGEKAKF